MEQQTSHTDKRSFPRAHARFLVSYGMVENTQFVITDVSQTRDIGMGGIRFTTSRPYEPDTAFGLHIRLPITAQPVFVKGRVLACQEVTPDSIYETRVAFQEIEERDRKNLCDTINYHVRKETLKGY
ncbi:MAG TPA: PilZ domain-containing protein [Candidatus Omnitrophota bacterium]|nr:PilZ domain-containing protein [Candidatus Omnitrophota bacterium]HRZ15082.1 PilZ domain-containing protein [Candidatus Omnitrophota bacterium]